MNLLVIHGPNLNLLGLREPDIYGKRTYKDLIDMIEEICKGCGIDVTAYQSNHEGAIIDTIHEAYGKYDGIIINPGAYTHYSIAILDDLKSVAIPTIEVHLSDIHSREEFRNVSITGLAALKIIYGMGFEGYTLAIKDMKEYLEAQRSNG